MDEQMFAKSEVSFQLHPEIEETPRSHTAMDRRLHSSSVRITEQSVQDTNPRPRATQGHASSPDVTDQIISPSRLQEVAGVGNLDEVSYLELSVNTSITSLGNFGAHLPNLTQLRLTQSTIHSIRDLGTSLGSLKVLWIAGCGLKDLDGLAAMPHLQELYSAHNEVCDISLVSLLSNLEVLDMESNQLSEEDQLGYLCLCPTLSILTLSGNPICQTLCDGDKDYRETIHSLIPQLKVLDDGPYDGVDTSTLVSASLSSLSVVQGWRDVSKGLVSPTSQADRDASRRSKRPSTSPSPSALSLIEESSSEESSSSLTHGVSEVLCGNPIRALRARQKRSLSSKSLSFIEKPSGGGIAGNSTVDDSITRPYTQISYEGNTDKLKPRPPHITASHVPPPTSRPHTAAADLRARRHVRPVHFMTTPPVITPPTPKDTANVLLTARVNPVRTRRIVMPASRNYEIFHDTNHTHHHVH